MSYIQKHLVGRTISSCTAFADDIVYGKVGCDASTFQSHLTGRRVVSTNRQGKYFYICFDKPPHAVLHLGMTGWMKLDAEETGYYRNPNAKEEEWPPRFMKFLLKCDKHTVDGEVRPAVEAAFVDARRLARIRLVDCDAENIRHETPLKDNGPDPVRDKDLVTVDWLKQLLGRKRVPVKALLLDQANLSGVGNWVADEVLYQARIHPEQYSNTFNDEQIKRLHDALIDVCSTAVETLADSEKFPETWLMKYRWDKGKKDSNVLPNGAKIVHLKVGGRTSAIVPSVQKKTAEVAGDVKEEDLEDGESEKKSGRGRKRKPEPAEDGKEDNEMETPAVKKGRGKKKADAEEADEKPASPAKKGGRRKQAQVDELDANGGAEDKADLDEEGKSEPARATGKKPGKPTRPTTSGPRRSARTKTR